MPLGVGALSEFCYFAGLPTKIFELRNIRTQLSSTAMPSQSIRSTFTAASVVVLVATCTLLPGRILMQNGGQAIASPAGTDAPSKIYIRSIDSEEVFEKYSRTVSGDRFAKFIIDVKTGGTYFFDVNVFKLHADFVLDVLLRKPWSAENIREYNKNYEETKPLFIFGYITEHKSAGQLTFSFWEGDAIRARDIAKVHKKLQSTFFKPLSFRPDSPAQEKVALAVKSLGIPVVTNNKLYHLQPTQALQNGTAIGRLRVVPKGTPFENLIFSENEIVLLQETYPDISPVAGILSTTMSTPLAHVNLRAGSWGIPNATDISAAKKYLRFDGKIVFYGVDDNQSQEVLIRLASPIERKVFRRKKRKKELIEISPTNLSNKSLRWLKDMRSEMSDSYGAKAANLGEIANAQLPSVHVPGGFGIPFSYYRQHIQRHKINRLIAKTLKDRRFEKSPPWRKSILLKIREEIINAPLDEKLLDEVYEKASTSFGKRGVFVRSSTNAEDLPGFNGAGLYDTVPNVKGRKLLGEAIVKVWASLWNFRAVEERRFFGIDHRKVYAGVLVQDGIDASAAGVLVTTNLYDRSETDAYTVNAKWGSGIRVVEGHNVPEQIIYDTSNSGTKIVSRSDDPVMLVFDENGGLREVPTQGRGAILNEARAKRLCDAVSAFRPLFPTTQILDVEWLFEGEKVWIVQARPFINKSRFSKN